MFWILSEFGLRPFNSLYVKYQLRCFRFQRCLISSAIVMTIGIIREVWQSHKIGLIQKGIKISYYRIYLNQNLIFLTWNLKIFHPWSFSINLILKFLNFLNRILDFVENKLLLKFIYVFTWKSFLKLLQIRVHKS